MLVPSNRLLFWSAMTLAPAALAATFAPQAASGAGLFAAAALTGMGTWMPPGYSNLCSEGALALRANWAYQQADAMLRERGK